VGVWAARTGGEYRAGVGSGIVAPGKLAPRAAAGVVTWPVRTTGALFVGAKESD
jgi:hypothetical protein